MSFLVAPILANFWRVLLVVLQACDLNSCDSAAGMAAANGLAVMLSFCAALGAISPDGLGVDYQPRSTATAPNPTTQYVLFQQGPVIVTRRSLTLAIRQYPFVYPDLQHQPVSTHDCTRGNYRWIESLMQPLRRLKWPVTEIALTLTLSLRFIPLVLEEVQNLTAGTDTGH